MYSIIRRWFGCDTIIPQHRSLPQHRHLARNAAVLASDGLGPHLCALIEHDTRLGQTSSGVFSCQPTYTSGLSVVNWNPARNLTKGH